MTASVFSRFHPAAVLFYFALMLGFTMFLMHPLCLAISLFSAIFCLVLSGGRKAVRRVLFVVVPLMLMAAVLNSLFSRRGETVLFSFSSGWDVTLETLLYGLAAAAMLGAAFCWFSCLSIALPGEILTELFGRRAPSLALVLSLSVRLVPRFSKKAAEISRAQRRMGNAAGKTVRQRAARGLTVLSAAMTWALESSVETADSMRARGWGLKGRSSCSERGFAQSDAVAVALTAALAVAVFSGIISGGLDLSYYPLLAAEHPGTSGIAALSAYAVLAMLPGVLNLLEERRWKSLESKISASPIMAEKPRP